MAHIHSIYDTDKHFVIDGVKRTITNEVDVKNLIVQHDHNSERFTFELPRYIDGHDMSTCNIVEVHYINISSANGDRAHGVYRCDDLQVSPDSDDVVICSWLISGNATRFVGNLSFVVRFVCSVDGELDYAWNTTTFTPVNVATGIYNGNAVAEKYADVLAEWEARIAALEKGGATDEKIEQAILDYLDENPIEVSGVVKTVNSKVPDKNGNVEIPTSGGESPVVTLNEFSDTTGSGVRISVDNPDGSGYVASVYDGKDGNSAYATVTKEGNVATITTRDATGVHSVEVYDGAGAGNNVSGLTEEQINALDGMFKIAAYTGNASAAYAAFKTAFGIEDSGDVHSHSYTSKVTTAATCTTAGVRTYTCSCGHSYTQSIPASGHSYGTGVVTSEPTCTANGVRTFTCGRCGTSKTEAIPSTGHNYVDGVCTVCGAADPTYNPDVPEPEVTLTSISAVYSGDDVPVGTAVGDLTGVVVTAHYSDGSSKPVTGYTLSGTIAEGSNTITVSYGGKTTTFTVTGVAESSGSEAVNLFTIGDKLVNSNNTPTIEWEEYGCSWKSSGYFSQVCTIPGLAPGKTYTIFADGTIGGTPNADTSRYMMGRMVYFEVAHTDNWSNQMKTIGDFYPMGGSTMWSKHLTFVVPESAVEVGLAFVATKPEEMNRIYNIAIYEGTLTERPSVEITVSSLSATYSGGDVAVGTSVNDLTGVVVTAHYSDGSSKTVTGYTLSGTIAEGSNTITVSYGSKTATFTVTGVAESDGNDAVNLYIGQLAGTATDVNNLHMEGNTITYEPQVSGSLCNVTVEGLEADKEYTIFVESTRADGGHAYTECRLTTASGWAQGTKLAQLYPSWSAAGKNYATFTATGNTLYLFFVDVGSEVAGTTPTLTIYVYEGTLTERP